MKYIIDFRYKTIHELYVALTHVITSYDMGRSEIFTASFTSLLDLYPMVGWMMSPPSLPKEIALLQKIEEELYRFLQLPENFLEIGKDLIAKCKELLYSLDPFTFSYDEPLGIRKSQIVEYARDLQVFLQTNLLSLEGKATSLIDEISHISNITNDIKRMKHDDFEHTEKDALQFLIELGDAHLLRPTVDKASLFLEQALKVEEVFRGIVDKETESATILVTTLIEIFEGEKEISNEPVVLSLLDDLRALPLPKGEANRLRNQAITAYEYSLVDDFVQNLIDLKKEL